MATAGIQQQVHRKRRRHGARRAAGPRGAAQLRGVRGAIGAAAPLMKADLHLTATQFGIAVAFGPMACAAIHLVGRRTGISVSPGLRHGPGAGRRARRADRFVGGLARTVVLRRCWGWAKLWVSGSSKMIARHVPPDGAGRQCSGCRHCARSGSRHGGGDPGGRAGALSSSCSARAPCCGGDGSWTARCRRAGTRSRLCRRAPEPPASQPALWLMGLVNATANFCAFSIRQIT